MVTYLACFGDDGGDWLIQYAARYIFVFCCVIPEPNTQFRIWTKAYTQRHEGKSSYPVMVSTDLSGPGAPVISNLSCQADGDIYLQWLRPEKLYGTVDLYYIYYRPEDSFEFEEIAVNSVNNRREHNVSRSSV